MEGNNMPKMMKPINDLIFKKLFGDEKHKDILLSFLNAVLRLPEKSQLTDITLVDTHINPDMVGDKQCILDVRAKTMNGEQINIEVQLSNQKDIEKRTLYYWANMYTDQLLEGQTYKDLKRTITINILDFKYFPTDQIHHIFRLYEKNDNFLLTEDLEIHTIELPKLKDESIQSDILMKWFAFLKVNEKTGMEEFRMHIQEPMIEKAVSILNIINQDPATRRLYQMREKALRDHLNMIETAEEVGMKKGMEKGKEEIIKKMLVKNTSTSLISELTDISIGEIEKIKSTL